MKLAIVAAVRPELGAAFRRLRPARVRRGALTVYEAGPLVFAIGGVGAARAEAAARALAAHARPDALLSAGFAGALADDLAPGDLVLGGSAGFPAGASLLRRARAADPAARIADCLAVDRVLVGPAEKAEARRRGGAVVVDMESAAVGRVARELGLPFLCVKAVLDTPAAPLASRYESPGRVLREILRRPATLSGLCGDAARARRAAARLAGFFAALKRGLFGG
jgi:adenosylhomocysteine nucleosidase